MNLKPLTPKPGPDENLLAGLLLLAFTECKIVRLRFLLLIGKMRRQVITLLLDTRDLCAEALGYEYVDCEDYQDWEYGNPERNQKQSTEDCPVSSGFEQANNRKYKSADDGPDGIMNGRRDVIFEFHSAEIDRTTANPAIKNHNPQRSLE